MVDALFRPLFFLLLGWFLGTAQVLKRHTTDHTKFVPFYLIPAYHLFYQAWVASALFYVSLEANRDNPAFAEKASLIWFFGNREDSITLLRTWIVIAVASVFSGSVMMFLVRRVFRPEDVKSYRQLVLWYSVYYLFQTLVAFFAASTIWGQTSD